MIIAAPPQNFSQVDFNQKVTNRDVDQSDTDKVILSDLGSAARMHAEEDVSHLTGVIPTTTELKAEFDKLAADKSIPFKYIEDGCYARAHQMCDDLHEDHINSAKMWVILDNKDDALTAHNEYMDSSWHQFHVAPMVYARDESTHKVEPYIVDPSLADHPLRPQDWIHQMWDGKAPIHLDVTPDAQYGRLEAYGRQTDFNVDLAPAREALATFSTVMARIEQNSKPAA